MSQTQSAKIAKRIFSNKFVQKLHRAQLHPAQLRRALQHQTLSNNFRQKNVRCRLSSKMRSRLSEKRKRASLMLEGAKVSRAHRKQRRRDMAIRVRGGYARLMETQKAMTPRDRLHDMRKRFDVKSLDARTRVGAHLVRKWKQAVELLMPLQGVSMSDANEIQVYNCGAQTYTEMWEAIKQAKERVWIETYIFKNDTIGKRFIQELTDAAKRGCDVVFMYDHFGCLLELKEKDLAPLKQAGGRVILFHPLYGGWPPRLPWQWKWPLFRTHRKILLADDIGFVGGMNIGEEYCSSEVGGTDRFRDSHAKVKGPCLDTLRDVFLDSIEMTGAQVTSVANTNANTPPRSSVQAPKGSDRRRLSDLFVQVLKSNPPHARDYKNRIAEQRNIYKSILITLNNATKNCYITNPYIVPPFKLRRAIVKAAKRGVDVRVITSGKCDVWFVAQAARHMYGYFLRRGVRLYEMQTQELHAKTITIDGLYASVGSYNLDYFSNYHMLEVNITSIDPSETGVARTLEDHFQKDLEMCKEVTLKEWEKRSWPHRIFHWLSYHFYTLPLHERPAPRQ